MPNDRSVKPTGSAKSALTGRSPMCTATSSTWPAWSVLPRSPHSNRVINVHPDWERLAGLAAGRAKRLFGLGYPRATRVVRLITVAMM